MCTTDCQVHIILILTKEQNLLLRQRKDSLGKILTKVEILTMTSSLGLSLTIATLHVETSVCPHRKLSLEENYEISFPVGLVNTNRGPSGFSLATKERKLSHVDMR